MARPTRPLISRDSCAEAALAIIDEEGLEALSLEKLATVLGVKAPSLYHHFEDKAEILASVARLVVLETPVPPEPAPDNWQEWMVNMCVGFRQAILKHPRAAPLLLQYNPRHSLLSSYERASRVLGKAGVPIELHLLIIEGTDRLTLGSGLYSASRVTGGQPAFPVVDPDRDPMLARALDANRWTEEEGFAETVRAFLRGAGTATPKGTRRRDRRRNGSA
ncbi:MAG: TetR family transcriptional regulator [Acidimicrobiia bacterium]